ncbi:response regulator receiver domain protein [mine drainage metagenome]|uniref:Response regulator receiver domain protein n=1 Tax=mine drainage metagenome TaxID=410659 RepID=A0A1J5SEF8_9ZZZZ
MAKQILVIDENSSDARITQLALQRHYPDRAIHLAASLPDGLARLAAEDGAGIDRVVVSSRMGGSNTSAFVAMLTRLYPEVAVFVVTGQRTPWEQTAFRTAGARAVIEKCFDFDDYISVLSPLAEPL